MRRPVYVVAAEYSAHPRFLPGDRRERVFLSQMHSYGGAGPEHERLFFRAPRRVEGWERLLGTPEPVGLVDLLASAGHRALCALHELTGADSYAKTRERVDGLFVTSMPGVDQTDRVNIGLLPQRLRGRLDLSPAARSQFLVGTSDAGAWAFAEAVNVARTAEQPVTLLVVAGQMMPSGYASQYQIRTVLGESDQELGLDMLAAGDLWMDVIRRTQGISRQAVEELLASVAARKQRAATAYPAAIRADAASERGSRLTPYFDVTDVAPPCCGAAAVVLTTDLELVTALRETNHPRLAGVPVLEVLGVGTGSSNPNLLARRSPLLFAPAIRQALATAADDAGLPPHVYPGCAFGVLHDAFPSIELAFLLSMGLEFDEAAARMVTPWPNPFGGLCAFGHAIGASGLVQVVKTFHIFAGDQRHLRSGPEADAEGAARGGDEGLRGDEPPGTIPREPPDIPTTFPQEGGISFTTSVGGPLSHVVAAIFHGGGTSGTRRSRARTASRGANLKRWLRQRYLLREVHRRYLERLDGQRPGARLVEGTTRVSIRTCLTALTTEEIERLRFEEVEALVRPEEAQRVRGELHETILAMQDLALQGSQMLEVFDSYHDALADRVRVWSREGILEAEAAAQSTSRLTERVKVALTAPLLVTAGPGDAGVERTVHVLPLPADSGRSLDEVDLFLGDPEGSSWDAVERGEARGTLPFWYADASRAPGAAPAPPASPVDRSPPSGSLAPAVDPDALCDQLAAAGRSLSDERSAELSFHRIYFGFAGSSALVDAAAAKITEGATVPSVPVVALEARMVDDRSGPDLVLACEILATATERASGWLATHELRVSLRGAQIGAVAFAPSGGDAADLAIAAARFARDVVAACGRHGIAVRAAVALGEGVLIRDSEGGRTPASDARSRAARLLVAQDEPGVALHLGAGVAPELRGAVEDEARPPSRRGKEEVLE